MAKVGPLLKRSHWEDFSNWTDPVDHLQRTYELTGPLEEVLFEAFTETKLLVASPAHPHVPTYQPTGRLFASGKTASRFDGSVWEGTITYGDASTQVVWRGGSGNYAVYERARGGVHDYFSGLDAFDQRYLDIIMDFFETRKRRR